MSSISLATIGGGCFWCVEAALGQLQGVEKVVSGYAGGKEPNPDYRNVCSGTTGHAEVVQIEFRPEVISYRDLLEIFFAVHDPTTLNRQGADVGTQYRSVIMYHDESQRKIAEELICEWNAAKHWPQPIVTQVVPLPQFFPAEDYHQSYYELNPQQPYCLGVVSQKVAKVRQKFASRVKS